MRVIVTRPLQEAGKWVQALHSGGYEAVSLPLIGVEPASDLAALHAVWERIARFDAVMFVSGNAVRHFFTQKLALAPVFTAQAAIKTRAFVTGPGSLSALLKCGVDAAFIDAPAQDGGQFDSEALWKVVGNKVRPGYCVLIVRGAGSLANTSDAGAGRDWFANQVMAQGGEVEYVVAYQRRRPHFSTEQHDLARRAAVDASVWLFSSSEAIANLVKNLPQAQWSAARAVVTHPRIGEAARQAGFGVVAESRPTPAAIMASIESLP